MALFILWRVSKVMLCNNLFEKKGVPSASDLCAHNNSAHFFDGLGRAGH